MDKEILEMVLIFVGLVTAMGCFTGIVIVGVKHMRHKPLPAPDIMQRLDDIAERMNRIETAVDATSVEVERIAEGQRFTTRLLADRGASPLADKTRPSGSITPH